MLGNKKLYKGKEKHTLGPKAFPQKFDWFPSRHSSVSN
jgi:hypothetical protein